MFIQKMLKEKNLSLMELSSITGIGYQSLQKYCKGERGITVENAKKIGEALNFDWWILFEEEKSEKT